MSYHIKKKARIRGSIVFTVVTGGGIGIRLLNQSQDTSPDISSADNRTTNAHQPVVSFSHPKISGSHITFNNNKKVTTITQSLAIMERKPGLHHGEGNAPSLPRIMADYGIKLKHLEHRKYSYDKENGLMVRSNDQSFIYYDPTTSSIFAARIDDQHIQGKKIIVNKNHSIPPHTAKK